MKKLLLKHTLLSALALFWGLFASCSDSFPDGALFNLMLIQKFGESSINGPYIFVTSTTYDGARGGISGADVSCNDEKSSNFSSLPGTSYKALLVDSTIPNRRACINPNCSSGSGEHVDWVLTANTTYYRPDGQAIMTTNDNAIFDFGGGNLYAPFSDNAVNWWTGLGSDWTVSGQDCNQWVNNAAITFGDVGIGSTQDGAAIQSTTPGCDNTYYLLCVQQ